MADEKLVLVERFEELRTGMRVVAKPCDWCDGAAHAGILVGPNMGAFVYDDGVEDDDESLSFDLLPKPQCSAELDAFGVDVHCVERGDIYRYAADLDMERELAAETNPYKEPAKVSERPRAGYWLSAR